MVYSGKKNWASNFNNASRTMTLPITTWAEMQELSNMIDKPLPIVIIRAIHEMWEFKRDAQRIKETALLERGLKHPTTSLE